jgi:hypothetical protein
MSDSSSSSFEHPIGDLVDALLEAVQSVVLATEENSSQARPAEFIYELDQVVSNYLDDHQISAEQFDSIQQDVVNSLAHQLVDDSIDDGSAHVFDDQGNASLTDVALLLDETYSFDHHSIASTDHGFDPGFA